MPKKILLIENDSAFAAELTQSLEQGGFDVRVTGDGKEGLDLAREWAPEAIVLCVELPGMSGYLVCQKLRKDDALKAIPLVLTSAEATEDTFEKHRALKVRADEYLLKPYAPGALVETLGSLVGLPEPAAPLEEEFVSLEEEMGLEALPSEPDDELPAFDLQSLPEEGTGDPTAGADEALALLDDAFDGLTEPSRDEPLRGEAGVDLEIEAERSVAPDELEAAAASLPDEPLPPEPGFGALDDADDALGALGALDVDEPLSLDPPAPAPVRGASADLLRAAGIKLLDDPPAPAPRAPAFPPPAGDAASQAAITRLERDLAEAQQALAEAKGFATGRDAELRQVRGRLDEANRRADAAEAAAEKARKAEAALDDARHAATRAEAELKAARDAAARAESELRARLQAAEQKADEAARRLQEAETRAEEAEVRAEDALAEARRKADELELAAETVARSETLERQLDEARAELAAARGEADGARGEVEKKTADLKKRVADLEALTSKHEERVLKAYQKIKNDEKVKEKVRKAIAIAAQLLDEGLPPAVDPEKARPAAAVAAAVTGTLLGRDS